MGLKKKLSRKKLKKKPLFKVEVAPYLTLEVDEGNCIVLRRHQSPYTTECSCSVAFGHNVFTLSNIDEFKKQLDLAREWQHAQ